MTQQEFEDRWFDELLGIAVRLDSHESDLAKGMFIRGRALKVKDLIRRIYQSVQPKESHESINQSDPIPTPGSKPAISPSTKSSTQQAPDPNHGKLPGRPQGN